MKKASCAALIHSKRRRGEGMGPGQMNIHFAKWIVIADAS
jgi:hypothetical protein